MPSVPADHFLIADGAPQPWLDEASVRHIRLDRTHGDFGNVARGIGAVLAAGEGYDAIAFLDADNRIDPDHVARCLAAGQTAQADVVIAQRRFELPDGTPVPVPDDDGLIDTNCLFMLSGAFPVIARWALVPPALAAIGDRLFHAALVAAGCRRVCTDAASLTYVSRWAAHYAVLGRAIPADARNIDLAAISAWLSALSVPELERLDHMVGVQVRAVTGAAGGDRGAGLVEDNGV
ncbi:MAG: glycosyltransferase [Sphingomonadales bacterium]|nr:glycosyltransferase [Sphingomonadales bacterium]